MYETACPTWGADLGEEFRSGFETDIPTVVVHGTWDVSTPFENALECLPFFENLNFVVVDGGTHGALGEAMGFSPDFAAALMAFATQGETAFEEFVFGSTSRRIIRYAACSVLVVRKPKYKKIDPPVEKGKIFRP